MTLLTAPASGTQWAGSATSVDASVREIAIVLPEVALPAAGLDVGAVDWAGVPGATAVEVTSAGFSVSAAEHHHGRPAGDGHRRRRRVRDHPAGRVPGAQPAPGRAEVGRHRGQRGRRPDGTVDW